MPKKVHGGGHADDVINIEEQVGRVSATAVDKQRSVRLGLHKTKRDQMRGEAAVPSTGSLLETVERLVQTTDKVGPGRILESEGLSCKHGLCQGAMEEGVLDIELVYWPVARSREV